MSQRTYYVLKVKGKAKIPDYIQVRDDTYTLVGYFRPGRAQKHSPRKTAEGSQRTEDLFNEKIEAACLDIPFGVITPILLDA